MELSLHIIVKVPDGSYFLELHGCWRKKDASFLLTVEVFLLTVRRFYLQWGNRK